MMKANEIISTKNLGLSGLDDLRNISPLLKQRLLRNGFSSLQDLIVRGPLDIMDALQVKSLWGVKMANDILKESTTILQEKGILKKFSSADELLEMRKQIHKISTGSKMLNLLLHGGIETGAVTEVYGKKNSGTLFLCYTLAMMVQQDTSLGGLGGNALFIDTRKRFNPEAMYQLALWRDFDPEIIAKNVLVVKPANTDELERTIKYVGSLIYKNNIKLIIFDCLLFRYNIEHYGREFLDKKQQKLNKHISMLKAIAQIYDIAIVITNQSQSSSQVNFEQEINTVGGNILAHNSTYKISFRKYSYFRQHYYKRKVKSYAKYTRVARIVNSPYQPVSEAFFGIGARGKDDMGLFLKNGY
jgi:DNA repair protein RadA